MKPHNSIIKYIADTEIARNYMTLCGGQELEEEFFVHDIELNWIPKCVGHSEQTYLVEASFYLHIQFGTTGLGDQLSRFLFPVHEKP